MNMIYKTFTFLVLLCAGQQALAQNFITRWDLSIPGSGSTQISFGTATSGTVNYIWYPMFGSPTSGSWSGSTLTITGLPAGETIYVEIEPTNFQQIFLDSGIDAPRLTGIEQWGTTAWTSMKSAFAGCTNLAVITTDVPNLSNVADMSRMFSGCTNLFVSSAINTWNTGAVNDMSGMFAGVTSFNEDIGSWNVSNVTDMSSLFHNATDFNQDISSWNVGRVTNMSHMFAVDVSTMAFNQNIGSWDVSGVTDMSYMFYRANNFNGDISSWDVSSVTNMDHLFGGAGSFNADIGSWNVGSVVTMSDMFSYTWSFNQDIGNWNVGNVTDMSSMFFESVFNQDISAWDVSNVTTMRAMFAYTNFNQNIGLWDVSSVTDMQSMFLFSSFNQNIGSWNTINLFQTNSMFYGNTFFNQDISGWNLNNLHYTFEMFMGATAFNQNISGWNVSNVIWVYGMFQGASSFNQNLGSWNVGNVTNMSNMLNNSGLSIANYDATLTGWASQTLKPNVPLGAVGLSYCTSVAARTTLTGIPNSWIISGDIQSCSSGPTITSFTPSSGPIGTTVIITGAKFSPTPTNNIVFFGATRATVMAATATQLTVTVPTGATYQPITVQVAGLTGFSSKPFVLTFAGGGSIDACSFAPRVDFATIGLSSGLEAVGAVADIDGDGKTDVLVANRENRFFSIYRSIATSGSISSGSFESKVDFSTGTGGGAGPGALAIDVGDVDGDGKQDIVVINYSLGTASVFRNVSTPGNISLQARVDFSIDSFTGLGVKLFDIDIDGKLDLVMTSFFQGVSILRNTSIVGVINASTFANRVNFPAGANPISFSIGDLDGDGKSDITVANQQGNTISILRNTSTSGSISLAPQVTFPTGNNPNDVELSDFDGDGKLDIAVPDQGSSFSITFFRNTSSIGSFSFSSFSYSTPSLAHYFSSVGDIDGDGKVDFAVPNVDANTVSVLKNTSIAGNISFALFVDFALNSTSTLRAVDIHIADIDGDGKNDLTSTNYGFSVLRNVIGEISPPTITSFTPSSGPIGTSVTITGTNFSTPFTNTVEFNGVPATITASTATSLTVTVPPLATTGAIEVTIGCNTVTSGANFLVGTFIPTITNFTPASGPIGTTVTITGTNFSTTPANNIVYFGATRATVTAATATQLTVTVPTGATYETISVLVNGLTGYSAHPFLTTFPGGGTINGCTLAPVSGIPIANIYFGLSAADYDQDGKIDVAVADLSPAGIKIYRNISTPGLIDASSFESPVDLANPSGGAYNIKSADLDGDGKIDIIVSIPTTDAIALYRNTSSSGVISFDSPVDFAAGIDPLYTSIADLDGDGKPEIAAINRFSNSLSIYKNTTVTGGFTSSSFAPKVDFAVGSEPYTVKIADLNADNKPDIVVGNSVSNTLSIFENTSLSGSINSSSFSAPITLPTGTFPHTSFLTDFDDDGKIDIAVANVLSNTVSVFRNIYSGGPITGASFQSAINLTANNGSVDVVASDMDGDGKVDIAVSNQSTDKISIFKNISSPGSISFEPKVDFINGPYPANMLAMDVDGDGKTDVVNMSVNSGTIGFFRNIADALPPTITSFTPSSGPVGTSVTISGANFSTPFSNTVKINGIATTITSSTATSFSITIPAGSTSGPFEVTIGCNTVTSSGNFTVTIPTITISTQPSDVVACVGVNASFSVVASGTTNMTYQWQFSIDGIAPFVDIINGGGYSDATTSTLSVSTTGSFGAGRYRCRINGDFVTEVISNDEGLFINPLPASPAAIGSSSCGTGSVTLNASGGANGQYRWYPAPTGGTAISGEVNGTYTTPAMAVTTSYYVALNDGTCESTRTEVIAQINPLPPAPTVTGASDFSPAVLTLTASGGTNGQYRWYTTPTGGTALPGEVNASYTTPPLSISATYYVTINNGQCESTRTPVVAGIKVNSAPVILSTTAEAPVEGTVTVSLTALISDPEDNLDFSTLTIVSQPISGARATIEPVNNLVLDYSGISFSGTDQLTIGICDQLAACSQKELTIEVVGDITVYNAISPNGDDKNPIFFLKNIDILADTKENKVTIFNRWGDVVFEAENYDNVNQVFRGLNKSGNELPSGTYYYRIEFASGNKTKTGFLVLKK